tara:strand:+ start:528 stop:788 length:261 start_codon:yes stop_codon:yes gene_type:complete
VDSPTYKNKIIYSIEEAAPFFYGEECLDADGKVKDKYLQRLRHACKLHREGKDGIFNIKVGTKIYIPKKAIDTLGEKFTQHNINLS